MTPASQSASAPRLEPAAPDDTETIAALLRAAGLPAEDFRPHLGNFLVARDGDRVVAAMGFERHGHAALLRSAVVAPTHRHQGLGTALLAALDHAAAREGVERFYLLTTTAEAFFSRHGFAKTARANVPAGIAVSPEFQSLCPASAVCLSRAVAPAGRP